ncbi:hypothetical protein HK098_007361 [Nowakowskiella sp. JEL0407]|nr:hypothetical protein HK098_007361 [Nowakowskiella sp. JEL0407]
MKFSTAIVSLLALASAVFAKPGRSPICDTANAKAAFEASPMAPNKQNLAQSNSYTFTSDVTTYTPGQKIVFTMTGPAFDGILMYVSGSADPTKRVGKFEIPDTFQNNAPVCTNSEFPESSITHKQGQAYDGNPKEFTYFAPALDSGDLTLNVIVVVKVAGGGFGWGIWPNAAKIGGSGTPVAQGGAVYGVTPLPEPLGGVDVMTECPKPFTVNLVRKCKVKTGFQTTISKTFTQMITMTETVMHTATVVSETTVTETASCTGGDVLGNQEIPTSMMHEMPTPTPMMEETPMPNNYNYGDSYGGY